MSERDFYQVLGVSRGATPGEIRQAYIRLVNHHHPDRAGHLPVRLRDVQQAYRCLSDPIARTGHDRAIAEAERAYLARQRSVQRRLGRYDGQHPRSPPRPRPHTGRRRWGSLAIAAVGLVLVAQISRALLG